MDWWLFRKQINYMGRSWVIQQAKVCLGLGLLVFDSFTYVTTSEILNNHNKYSRGLYAFVKTIRHMLL